MRALMTACHHERERPVRFSRLQNLRNPSQAGPAAARDGGTTSAALPKVPWCWGFARKALACSGVYLVSDSSDMGAPPTHVYPSVAETHQ